ncbi:MAG: hypothetical protein EA392_12840 [Cryomorphaceae bacterium]|nr:MAG: hypothetical protein EA392_12840 [Cryomorphaceae bacterium]
MQLQKPPVSERFLASFDDPGVFDCEGFNLLKVAQDSVFRRIGEHDRTTYIGQSFAKISLRLFLSKLRARLRGVRGLHRPRTKKKPDLMYLVPPRFVDVEGVLKHQYLSKLTEKLKREEYYVVYLRGKANGEPSADAHIGEIIASGRNLKLNAHDRKMISGFRRILQRVPERTTLTREDVRHIEAGLDEFWQAYRAVRAYLELTEPSMVVMAPGYYTEYFIAAARSLQIKVIELQHGVITPASHFYVYPQKIKPVAKRALFADEVWLFGNYWKEQLQQGAEYEPGQIKVFGDYFLRNPMPGQDADELARFSEKYSTRVLVGTQNLRHVAFNELIGSLSKRYLKENPETGIVIKLHPAEAPALYADVTGLPNVLVCSSSLDYLYGKCQYYVSMYSNTLFEATRFPGLKRAVLHSDKMAAFVEAIAALGVAAKMHADEDPMKLDYPSQAFNPDHFFQKELNHELLQVLNPNAV